VTELPALGGLHPTAVLRKEHARFIEEAAQMLSDAVTVRDVSRVLAELPLPGLPPDGLALASLENGRLQILGSTGHLGETMKPFDCRPLGGAHPAATAIRMRTPVFISNREEYRVHYPQAWSRVSPLDTACWAFLPLIVGRRPIGVCLIGFDDARELDTEDRALLCALSGLVAQSLARARLHDSEHEVAAILQRTMLPRRVPAVPGVTTTVRYLPADSWLHIGGDWYDVLPLPGRRVGLVIGDVQGHDVDAAGVMGQLRIALCAYAAEGHPPAAVMAKASRFLADLDTGRFATCTYVEVDINSGETCAVRAGHLDPVVRHTDGTAVVHPVVGGLPLGIDPKELYDVTRFNLELGEVVVLTTDGLVEERTADLDDGMERLRRLVGGPLPQGHDGRDPLETLADRTLTATTKRAEHEDDIALLLMRWDGPRPTAHGSATPSGRGIRPARPRRRRPR
jgi:serine phosphatase RsbU (regulator of sigma subunit)